MNGVIGTRTYDSDSDLYGAMGYVRKAQRKSGLTQKSSAPLQSGARFFRKT